MTTSLHDSGAYKQTLFSKGIITHSVFILWLRLTGRLEDSSLKKSKGVKSGENVDKVCQIGLIFRDLLGYKK
jgi:hypothetical protein